MAVVWGLSKMKQYLGRKRFQLVTDSAALKGLMSSTNLSGKIARWALYLSELDYEVIHKPGKSHGNADGLSRSKLIEETPTAQDEALAAVWCVDRY